MFSTFQALALGILDESQSRKAQRTHLLKLYQQEVRIWVFLLLHVCLKLCYGSNTTDERLFLAMYISYISHTKILHIYSSLVILYFETTGAILVLVEHWSKMVFSSLVVRLVWNEIYQTMFYRNFQHLLEF